VTAPPPTALQIAQMLAAGKIDTTQAGKLSKAWNISTLHVAQVLNVLRAAGERQEPDVRSPALKQLDAHFPTAKPEDFIIRGYARQHHLKGSPTHRSHDAGSARKLRLY
jgi:hypothetical protein